MQWVSKSEQETQKIAKKVLDLVPKAAAKPVVLALYGEFGAGKTTFTQALAELLGVKDYVRSPTFVLIKEFDLPKKFNAIERLIHIDCYRIDDSTELTHLGLDSIFANPGNIVVVEWADRIEELLPPNAIRVELEISGETERRVTIKT